MGSSLRPIAVSPLGTRGSTMQMCQLHFDALRVAIEARGLGHLIAPTEAEIAERVEREMVGRARIEDFEPLMAGAFAIYQQAATFGGDDVMRSDFGCPVCEIGNDTWIEGAADEMLVSAGAHGLVQETVEVESRDVEE